MPNVLDQIKKLDEQRTQLLETAKQEALDQAQQAVQTLNELGFGYRLVEETPGVSGQEFQPKKATQPRAPRAATGTRRTGIREDVLRVIQENGDGVAPADIRKLLSMEEKGDGQAVSNALTALKAAGKIQSTNGVYTAT